MLLLQPVFAAGQHPLSYTRLTVEDGLSNNSVQCILQDRNGIVWIGTNGGLNRYDGNFLVQYSILSHPALTNNVITALLQDDDGRIWIGTEDGLNILDPHTNVIRKFVHEASGSGSLPQGPVRAIQKRKDGHIWVLSERWLVEFAGSSRFLETVVDPGLLKTDMVMTSVAENDERSVWVSYLDHPTTLATRNVSGGKERIGAPLLFAPDYSKIYIDAKDDVWGVSCYGISRFDEHTLQFMPWIKNCHAIQGPNLHLHTCYCTDADGHIWQGTDRAGLVEYDLRRRQVTDYSWMLAAENASIVYCVYKDNNNTIWAGTDNGIIRISNRPAVFTPVRFVAGGQPLKDMHCRRIMADRKGDLYAATENYGLLRRTSLPNGSDTTIALSRFGSTPVSALPIVDRSIRLRLDGRYDIGYIYDMWYDHQDVVWLAGFGIGRFDTRTDSLEIFLAQGTEQEKQESINQFSICFDGRLFWTAGQYNLYTFDPRTRTMEPFRDDEGRMPFHYLSCWSLTEKDGFIWAGAANGLYKIDIRSHRVAKLSLDGRLDYGINDLSPDGDSSLWICTAGGGVIHYHEKSGKTEQYTNKEGLSNNTVCGMLRDKNGDLWISTYAGLSYFNRKSSQFTNFYSRDGLPADEFNRKAFYRMADGRMIFGGLNGYVCFDPDRVFQTREPVRILLTRFDKTNGSGRTTESVFNGESPDRVVIEPGDKYFSFDFMLSDLYDPAGNRFSYQLQGVDDTWHPIGSQHFVSFNSLSPGSYTLKIKGYTESGSPSINELSIDIRVRQVFYKTIWFIALVIAAAVTVLWLVVRYRIRQFKKIQYLRTRIASDLHDDVGSSLVRITILADAIRREGITENTPSQLGSIAGISRGAVSTMKDVVWSIDARNDTMLGMIQYMQEHLYNMLAPANIDFELTHAGVADQEPLTMNFRQNVYLTFKEAINNIVKHSGASRVVVDLKREKGWFIMLIRDDGKGMDDPKTGSGQGLYNMRLRAGRLKARLEILSAHGVTIVLSVPT